jgi:hypothetical protein
LLLHFDRDGDPFGPYPLEEAREYLKRGEILPTDRAWFEGAADWMPVMEVPGMIGTTSEDAAPPPAPTSAQATVVAQYSSATTKFNRRFFETELGRFLKLNPEDNPEQIFMRTRNGDFTLHRVAKVEPDHCIIAVNLDGVRKDKRVDYFNINEIEIRSR